MALRIDMPARDVKMDARVLYRSLSSADEALANQIREQVGQFGMPDSGDVRFVKPVRRLIMNRR